MFDELYKFKTSIAPRFGSSWAAHAAGFARTAGKGVIATSGPEI
jgi:hypothetical protein